MFPQKDRTIRPGTKSRLRDDRHPLARRGGRTQESPDRLQFEGEELQGEPDSCRVLSVIENSFENSLDVSLFDHVEIMLRSSFLSVSPSTRISFAHETSPSQRLTLFPRPPSAYITWHS